MKKNLISSNFFMGIIKGITRSNDKEVPITYFAILMSHVERHTVLINIGQIFLLTSGMPCHRFPKIP